MKSPLKTWKQLSSHQPGPVWLPVLPPASALVELAGLMGAIALIDGVLPNVDTASLEPSPYWIPVLLLSLQYGTVAGLLAAGVATAAYVLHGVPEQGIGENLFTYLLKIWALPILWMGVSLLVGQFRLRQIEAKQELMHQLDQCTRERDSLAGYSSGLEGRVQRLERQLSASSGATSGAMLDALASLADGGHALEDAFKAAAQEAFPGAALSVWMVSPNGIDLVLKTGWPPTSHWRGEIAAAEPLYRAVAVQRRALSVLEPADEHALQGEGLAACPVETSDGARIIGIVKLERADAGLLTPQTPARLGVIARALAAYLGEPRIVINNDEAGQAGKERAVVRLTRGWRHVSWREEQGTGAPAGARDGNTGKAGPSRV